MNLFERLIKFEMAVVESSNHVNMSNNVTLSHLLPITYHTVIIYEKNQNQIIAAHNDQHNTEKVIGKKHVNISKDKERQNNQIT